MPNPKPRKAKGKVESAIEDLSKALDEVSGKLSKPPRTEALEEDKKQKYVVVRDNRRVNEDEYDDPKDPRAQSWVAHYKRITDKWPDGTKTEVVPYNNKIHRIYGEIKQ